MISKFIKIDNLIVNQDNPRNEPQENEIGAIKILLKQEKKLFNLMKSIARYGYDISEKIIVMEADKPNNYLVMDGNRRITCIKLLNNPELLPSTINERSRLINRINKIVSENKYETIIKVECVIYDIPAEEKVMKRVIQNKHTGENDGAGRLQWDYKAQARFNNDDYKKYLVDYLDNILKVDRSFSTMERIFGDPDMRTLLGILIDKKIPSVQLINTESIKKIYYILSLIQQRKINVSDVYYKQDREEFYKTHFIEDNKWNHISTDFELNPATSLTPFVEEIKENQNVENTQEESPLVNTDVRDDREQVTTTKEITDSKQEIESSSINNDILIQPEPIDTKKQNRPEYNAYLFQGIVYNGNHKGIQRTLYELHRLRISTHNLSATYLTRTLIECSLQEYLLKNNLFEKWKSPERDPSITDLLNYCVNQKVFSNINQNYQRTINTAYSKKDHDELNSISHGKYNLPSIEVLRDIERRWTILLKHIIENLNLQGK